MCAYNKWLDLIKLMLEFCVEISNTDFGWTIPTFHIQFICSWVRFFLTRWTSNNKFNWRWKRWGSYQFGIQRNRKICAPHWQEIFQHLLSVKLSLDWNSFQNVQSSIMKKYTKYFLRKLLKLRKVSVNLFVFLWLHDALSLEIFTSLNTNSLRRLNNFLYFTNEMMRMPIFFSLH